jgi:hypothetical protein
MKRVLIVGGIGGIALLVGAAGALATLRLPAGTALAGGFGWMIGGLPPGEGGGEVSGGGDGGGGGE